MPKTIPEALRRTHFHIDGTITTDGVHSTYVELALSRDEIEGPTVTGIARCAPNDTFDSFIGIDLATVRALRHMTEQFEAFLPAEDRDESSTDRASREAIDQMVREISDLRGKNKSLRRELKRLQEGSAP